MDVGQGGLSMLAEVWGPRLVGESEGAKQAAGRGVNRCERILTARQGVRCQSINVEHPREDSACPTRAATHTYIHTHTFVHIHTNTRAPLVTYTTHFALPNIYNTSV